ALVEGSPDGRLRLWAHGDAEPAAALAEALGFARGRVLRQMRRSLADPLPPPALPDGVGPMSEHVLLHLPGGGDDHPGGVQHVLALDDDGTLVGYAHLDVTDRVAGSSGELVVDPEARGRGYGRALAQALVEGSPDGRLRLWAHGDAVGDVEVRVADQRAVVAAGEDVPDAVVAAAGQVQQDVLRHRPDAVGRRGPVDQPVHRPDVVGGQAVEDGEHPRTLVSPRAAPPAPPARALAARRPRARRSAPAAPCRRSRARAPRGSSAG
ncbi:MAG TPA: GNAT family N-acetyltransferase, partial [Mycobacteriales bacterium]|nr:GNAT family N-acetyltransferase [Mycobacteriales bacterium]